MRNALVDRLRRREVTGEAPPVVQVGDTVMFNSKAFKMNVDASAEELVISGSGNPEFALRRTLVRIALCSLVLGSTLASAQPTPDKPIRLLVGFSPGGGVDEQAYERAMRALAAQLPRDATVAMLEASGLTYESEGALWLSTTRFGDDKDRVMRKADGSYRTYDEMVAEKLGADRAAHAGAVRALRHG